MPCVLISTERNLPPGEFMYEQTVGIYRKFGKHPELVVQAGRVSAFRTANNLPRPSKAECAEDIILYTCQRLGCNPAWCRDSSLTTAQVAQTIGIPTGGCATCGAKIVM